MSPNESQLRAALQQGEGDSPDATHLISHAMRVRHDRRRRITSIAGGVAAVAVIGVGLTALVTSGSNSESASSSAGGGTSVRGDAQGAAAGSSAAGSTGGRRHALAPRNAASAAPNPHAYSAPSAARAAVAALRCPATADRFMLPGGGGSGQFGSGDPLFPQPVSAMKVCAYPQRANAQLRTQTLRAPVAGQIATALDAAPDSKSDSTCPANTDYVGGQIEILAVDARGRPLKPVVLTLGCRSSQTTNGTAVRYVADLPAPFLRLLTH
jgi:hypothetical protein